MACYSPFKAHRLPNGVVKLGASPDSGTWQPLRIPCGRCLGCRESSARDWALRAYLELWEHSSAAFVTLTYAPEHLPPTLTKRHPQLYMKRLRVADQTRKFRVFGCGEYGDRRGRPHYHLVIYGADPITDRSLLTDAWRTGGERFTGNSKPLGIVDLDKVTPRVISYVAGYVSKKLLTAPRFPQEELDPTTGELYEYVPPYRIVSRNPGLGGNAREKWHSWRDRAVLGGVAFPPPRYLHEAWKAQASPEEVQRLELEKRSRFRIPDQATLDRLRADAWSRLALKEQRRQKL